jgi:hypothetical protein
MFKRTMLDTAFETLLAFQSERLVASRGLDNAPEPISLDEVSSRILILTPSPLRYAAYVWLHSQSCCTILASRERQIHLKLELCTLD